MKTFDEFLNESKDFSVEFQYRFSKYDEIEGYRAVIIGSKNENDVVDVIEAKDLKTILNSSKFKKFNISKAIVAKTEVNLNSKDIEKALKSTL
ncbi:hypothetical protein vBSdyM006_128 [Shigella phage vB_SdyM_006]|nr:hypothetical protein vBSdyM006_128 [Shigella phage vB_SdyM_006]